MSIRTTALFALILLVLGGYFYLFEVRKVKLDEEREARETRLLKASKEAIEEIKLKWQGEEVVVKKEGDQWKIIQPLEIMADQKAAESIISALDRSKIERVIEKNPSKLDDFGLAQPALEVSLNIKNASPEIVLIGQANPTQSFIYAKKGESPEVFLTSFSLKSDLDKKLYDLRDKTALDVSFEQVKTIELHHQAESITLTAGDGGVWTLSHPLRDRVDVDKVRQLVTKIRHAKIKEFFDGEQPDLASAGLTRPSSIALHLKEGEVTKTLLIGAIDEEKNGIYAKRDGEEKLFLLEKSLVSDLFPKIDDLRDKKLFTFENTKIEKIEINSEGTEITLSRIGDEQWEIMKPITARADRRVVDNFLASIKGMKIDEFLPLSSEPQAGFHSPTIEIKLLEQGGELSRSLSIGGEIEGKEQMYGWLSDREGIFALPKWAVSELKKSPADFIDKRILSFKNDDVEEIDLKQNGQSFHLEKEKREWKAIKPEKAKVKEAKVRSFLWDLNDLEYKERISEKPSEGKEYRFDQPTVEITLLKKGREAIMELLIVSDAKDGEKAYAKMKKDQTIYAIDPKFLTKIPKGLDDLK
ncbi:MAG: DUF4340 domain-containing protein [Candidatus Tectomicrobia bacterium]|nr:DUF4340 domain-containing protein [Candidatus Tectomicrobia bacterium]